jgi:hypothetical protein
MRITWRRAIPALAAAAGITLASAGAAGTANAARTGPASPAVAALAGNAPAVAVSNHQIPGHEAAISCLTATRCVAVGYQTHRGGQIVVLVNGKKAGNSRLPPGQGLLAVSCPTRLGCWAVGVRKGGLNFVKLGPHGTITRLMAVTGRGIAAARLNQISCVSMTSCELVGSGFFNTGAPSVQLASWNGRKLRLTPDSDNGNFLVKDVGGLSCWQTTCVTVGTTISDSTHDFGFILTIKHGTPGKVDFGPANKWFLSAVSCVSSSTCYAVGSGVVVTVTDGAYGSVQPESAGAGTIECARTTCWAAGIHTLEKITSGAVTGSHVTDTAVLAFTGIARRGTGFAAIGEARSRTASVVATG